MEKEQFNLKMDSSLKAKLDKLQSDSDCTREDLLNNLVNNYNLNKDNKVIASKSLENYTNMTNIQKEQLKSSLNTIFSIIDNNTSLLNSEIEKNNILFEEFEESQEQKLEEFEEEKAKYIADFETKKQEFELTQENNKLLEAEKIELQKAKDEATEKIENLENIIKTITKYKEQEINSLTEQVERMENIINGQKLEGRRKVPDDFEL